MIDSTHRSEPTTTGLDFPVKGSDRIEQAIRAASAAEPPALAAFLTAGFPTSEVFDDVLAAVAAEADLVEIGVPFSDPMADGVTIQRSSRIALEGGVTLAWILDCVSRAQTTTPIILMSYLNPLLAFGIESLAQGATAAGVAGVIVPDLPYEECGQMRDNLDSLGLALIQLVTPVTPRDRVRKLCEASRGFVYAVTMTGTTGGTAYDNEDVLTYLSRVREVSPLPVLAGFGIRSAAQVQSVARHADGIIVGSALLEVLERREDPVAFLRELRSRSVERKLDQ